MRELGLEDVSPPPHGTLYRTDIGLPHCGYSISAGSDADTEADAVMSPEHPVRLWGRNPKSGRSSCLSSRANSNLTLTDTEHDNTETGKRDRQGDTGASVLLLTLLSICFSSILLFCVPVLVFVF